MNDHPFHFLSVKCSAWMALFDPLPSGNFGFCDHHRHIIQIDPSKGEVEVLDTCVHEWLHMEKPLWGHKRVNMTARTIAGIVILQGVTRLVGAGGSGGGTGTILAAVGAGLEITCPKWGGPKLAEYSEALTEFLLACGYREPTRKTRRRRAGVKKQKRIGFATGGKSC